MGEKIQANAADGSLQCRILAILLAMAVATADGRLSGRALGYVRGWALAELDLAAICLHSKRRFEKSLLRLGRLLAKKVPIDIQEICSQITQKGSLADRYDILEFCLVVAAASGGISEVKLLFIKDLSTWLQLDPVRFRAMMEKTIPMEAFKIIDTTVLLGLRPDMPREDALHLLNQEYAKWNARVTNPDDQVRSQADQMLHLIALTRNQYTE